MIRKIIIAVLFSLSFWSCKTNYEVVTPEKIFNKIIDQIGSDTSVIKRLDTSLSFSWDKMIVLKPYQETLAKECGFELDLSNSKIQATEGLDEYLFIKDKKLIMHVISNGIEKKGIRLVVDKSLDNVCGIDNSSDLFIKLLSDSSHDFYGKTFLIFKK